MIFQEKCYILRDGRKISIKSPEVEDANMLLNHIVKVASSTDYLLSEPEDFGKYYQDISKEEALIKSYQDGPDYLFAVYLEGNIIGNSSLNFHHHVKDKHRARIGIAIQKDYWDLGIGTILMQEMIKVAKATPGIEQIELGVISVNERAKHLYSKVGFRKVGTLPRQLKLKDGTYLDEDMMVLLLK